MQDTSIASRLSTFNDRVAAAAHRSERDPGAVRVVAVSKTFGLPEIIAARDAGQSIFGENRAQEFASKAAELPEVQWHFVGHLQTNKVKQVVGAATLIHSLDSERLAEAISKRAAGVGAEQAVLLEVNVAGDEQKHGIAPDEVADLVAAVRGIEGLSVRGLMTIPPWPENPEDSRPYYKELAALAANLAPSVDSELELSMGMTRDFEVAIEEGATLIRVGEAIFGPRPVRS
jgi:PLP dependent protein